MRNLLPRLVLLGLPFSSAIALVVPSQESSLATSENDKQLHTTSNSLETPVREFVRRGDGDNTWPPAAFGDPATQAQPPLAANVPPSSGPGPFSGQGAVFDQPDPGTYALFTSAGITRTGSVEPSQLVVQTYTGPQPAKSTLLHTFSRKNYVSKKLDTHWVIVERSIPYVFEANNGIPIKEVKVFIRYRAGPLVDDTVPQYNFAVSGTEFRLPFVLRPLSAEPVKQFNPDVYEMVAFVVVHEDRTPGRNIEAKLYRSEDDNNMEKQPLLLGAEPSA